MFQIKDLQPDIIAFQEVRGTYFGFSQVHQLQNHLLPYYPHIFFISAHPIAPVSFHHEWQTEGMYI